MASRRMVGLLKTIRNVAFAHRSQHVLLGRFDTEEDVMRYMLDPFPWLLMTVYQLDQEHKIAGSVAEQASAKTSDSAVTTDEGTSRDASVKKSAKKSVKKSVKKSDTATTTSADEAAVPMKKVKHGKKDKGGYGPKAPNQMVQKDKQIGMQKRTISQLRAELAQLRGESVPTEHPNQEPAPVLIYEPELEQLESIQLTTKDPKDVSP
jgi:hypothetical protein